MAQGVSGRVVLTWDGDYSGSFETRGRAVTERFGARRKALGRIEQEITASTCQNRLELGKHRALPNEPELLLCT